MHVFTQAHNRKNRHEFDCNGSSFPKIVAMFTKIAMSLLWHTTEKSVTFFIVTEVALQKLFYFILSYLILFYLLSCCVRNNRFFMTSLSQTSKQIFEINPRSTTYPYTHEILSLPHVGVVGEGWLENALLWL